MDTESPVQSVELGPFAERSLPNTGKDASPQASHFKPRRADTNAILEASGKNRRPESRASGVECGAARRFAARPFPQSVRLLKSRLRGVPGLWRSLALPFLPIAQQSGARRRSPKRCRDIQRPVAPTA